MFRGHRVSPTRDSFRAFLVDVARYAGGVIFEDPVGRLGMISLIRTRLLVSNIQTIDYRDHRILTKSQLFARRDDLVTEQGDAAISRTLRPALSEELSRLAGSVVGNAEGLFEVFTTDSSVVIFADWPNAATHHYDCRAVMVVTAVDR